jgi:hypothetical protein
MVAVVQKAKRSKDNVKQTVRIRTHHGVWSCGFWLQALSS